MPTILLLTLERGRVGGASETVLFKFQPGLRSAMARQTIEDPSVGGACPGKI